MASIPPHPAACLLVVLLCFVLVATALWMQSVELRLPIMFYRCRRTVVRDVLLAVLA